MSDSHPVHPSGPRLRQADGFLHIPFRTVPVQPRHDGWTAERQRGFIDRLCLTGCVARSARAVGKSPQSAYRLRERKGAGSFRRAWDRALAAGQSFQIDVAMDRALNGVVLPVVRNGVVTSMRFRCDNRLAMTVLNALDRRAVRCARGLPESIPPLDE